MSKTGLSLQLIGQDGNAFSILGRARKVMQRAGLSDETIKEFHAEATAGDYNHLLQTCMDWFDTDEEDGDE